MENRKGREKGKEGEEETTRAGFRPAASRDSVSFPAPPRRAGLPAPTGGWSGSGGRGRAPSCGPGGAAFPSFAEHPQAINITHTVFRGWAPPASRGLPGSRSSHGRGLAGSSCSGSRTAGPCSPGIGSRGTGSGRHPPPGFSGDNSTKINVPSKLRAFNPSHPFHPFPPIPSRPREVG